MKANELRIGNYVQSLDDNNIPSLGMELMEIVGIKHNGEGYYNPKHEIGKRYKDLEQHGWFSEDCELFGIPLTEDLLVKCGFMFEHNYFKKGELDVNYCLKYYPHLVGYYFYIEYNDSPNEKDIAQYYPISSTYKYLHQLQNLYFALTGEELNVNL